MKNEYKLTSITFSDENDDQVIFYEFLLYSILFLPRTHDILFLQDFELWDDVGLNIPKPPDLLQLYRNCGNSLPLHRDTVDVAVNVDPKDLPGDYFTQEPVQQTEAIQVLFTCLHEHSFPIKVHILLKPLFWVMAYDKYFSHFSRNWILI